MSNVFTVTTELKLNNENNQMFRQYISDYIEYGSLTQKDKNIIHAQLKE